MCRGEDCAVGQIVVSIMFLSGRVIPYIYDMTPASAHPRNLLGDSMVDQIVVLPILILCPSLLLLLVAYQTGLICFPYTSSRVRGMLMV